MTLNHVPFSFPLNHVPFSFPKLQSMSRVTNIEMNAEAMLRAGVEPKLVTAQYRQAIIHARSLRGGKN
jgi:hypothetical protein